VTNFFFIQSPFQSSIFTQVAYLPHDQMQLVLRTFMRHSRNRKKISDVSFECSQKASNRIQLCRFCLEIFNLEFVVSQIYFSFLLQKETFPLTKPT
jgi:hypothetical protein